MCPRLCNIGVHRREDSFCRLKISIETPQKIFMTCHTSSPDVRSLIIKNYGTRHVEKNGTFEIVQQAFECMTHVLKLLSLPNTTCRK